MSKLIAAFCLLLAGCSTATPSASAPSASSPSASSGTPSLTPRTSVSPPVTAGCPKTMPEPSGTGPAGEFVPPNPTDALVCRYDRASKLETARTLPHTLAVGLAADLNNAKPADPGIRCAAPTTWTIWIFRGPTPATVKAGWCNHVIGESRTVTLPHTTSLR